MATTYYVILLENFNNYFNRIVKGYSTVVDYEAYAGDYFRYTKPINYIPNDNVSTEIVMNECIIKPDYCVFYDNEENIVSRWFVLKTIITREGQKKFILRRDVLFDHLQRLLSAPMYVQKGFLRPDDPMIFNDEGMNFNEIKSNEILLKDRTGVSWVALYLSKNTDATDVNIQTASAEVVDYVEFTDLATDIGISQGKLAGIINYGQDSSTPFKTSQYFTFSWSADYKVGSAVIYKNFTDIELRDFAEATDQTTYQVPFSDLVSLFAITDVNKFWNQGALKTAFSNYVIANKNSIISDIETIYGSAYLTYSQYKKLLSYTSKIIKYNDKLYRLSFSQDTRDPFKKEIVVSNTYPNLKSAITSAATSAGYTDWVTNNGQLRIRPSGRNAFSGDKRYFLHFNEISPADYPTSDEIPSIQTTISASRKQTLNQSFDLVVIPVESIELDTGNGIYNVHSEEGIALRLASAIATQLDQQCYDVQLLPYCPLPDLVGQNKINLRNLTSGIDFNYIMRYATDWTDEETTTGVSGTGEVESGWEKYETHILFAGIDFDDALSCEARVTGPGEPIYRDVEATLTSVGGFASVNITLWMLENSSVAPNLELKAKIKYKGLQQVSVMLYCESNSFQAYIDQPLTAPQEFEEDINLKVQNLVYKYRLCSPNYQGSFDFSLAKNGGRANYFLADCTYRPYTPYIKVAPEFSNLYGANFNDCRGLICGGDYSLPRFSDAWINYQLNNKNYQNIFNREIQNLEFHQDQERLIQLISGLSGGVGSASYGAGAGSSLGGIGGAVGGGVVGALGGAIGGAVDYALMARRQKETKDYALDKFTYTLGNIKALPYTLTKIGAFDFNNKIWPFVEIYSATEQEIEALKSKITYESMTVNRIDVMRNYYQEFADDSEKKYFKAQMIRNFSLEGDNYLFEIINDELMKGVYI